MVIDKIIDKAFYLLLAVVGNIRFFIPFFGFFMLLFYRNDLKVYYVKSLPFGYNAMTIPPFGIFMLQKHRNNTLLLDHEKVHQEQYKRNGLLLFWFSYLYHHITVGYDGNPMEVEARYIENHYVKYNYTESVKNGTAKTVNNENFKN